MQRTCLRNTTLRLHVQSCLQLNTPDLPCSAVARGSHISLLVFVASHAMDTLLVQSSCHFYMKTRGYLSVQNTCLSQDATKVYRVKNDCVKLTQCQASLSHLELSLAIQTIEDIVVVGHPHWLFSFSETFSMWLKP